MKTQYRQGMRVECEQMGGGGAEMEDRQKINEKLKKTNEQRQMNKEILSLLKGVINKLINTNYLNW